MRAHANRLRPLVLAILAAAFCEAVLWAADYPDWRRSGALTALPEYFAPDARLGWKPKSGEYKYHDPARAKDIILTFGADGSRRTSEALNRAVPEVLLLGDSYVMGHGLSDEETFAWRLQTQAPALSVKNLGAGGYGTCQVLLQSREFAGRIPAPRAVRYFLNSFHEERNVGSPLSVRRSGETAVKACAGNLSAGGELKVELVEQSPRWRLSEHLRSAALIEDALRVTRLKLRADHNREITRAMLRELAAAWRATDFKVVLLDFSPSSAAEYAAFLKEDGVPFLDCSAPFHSAGAERMPDGHPGRALSDRIADCIAEDLTEKS